MKKVVILTGAARGIGKAIALKLSGSGFSMILVDVLDLSETIKACPQDNGISGVKGDLLQDSTLAEIKKRLDLGGGQLIGLVNNAFSMITKPFLELSEEDWRHTLDSTFMSAVRTVRLVLPYMLSSRKGSIVNVSSAHTFASVTGFSAYEAAKSAMDSLTRSLATEYGPGGIRANSIAPGLVITERNRSRWYDSKADLEYVKNAYPSRRPGNPEEVASLVNFLISDESSFVSGTTIPVDGGLLSNLPENTALSLARLMDRSDA